MNITRPLAAACAVLLIATASLAQTTTRNKPAWAKPPAPAAPKPTPSDAATPAFTDPADTDKPSAKPAKAPSTAGKVDLRPRFKLGQEVRFAMDLSNTRKQTGGGQDAPNQKQDISITVVMKCTGVDPESGYTLDLVYENFKFDGELGGQPVHFDSKKPKADDPMGELMGSIVGTSMPVKMDLSGNITSVGGGMTDLSALGGAGGSLGGADLIKGMFGPLSTSKKGTGLANVGDTWTNEDSMDAGLGHVRIKTTNTLKSAVGGTATIVTKGTFNLDPSSSGPGVSIRESSMNGETQWDTASGMLDSMTMKQKVQIEQRPQQGGQPSSSSNEMNVNVRRVRK